MRLGSWSSPLISVAKPSVHCKGYVKVTTRRLSVIDEASSTIYSRHLLRSILRECTYLPDFQARVWMQHHILQRFRSYSYKPGTRDDSPEFQERVRRRLGEARQAFNQLSRANEGERAPLLKVFLMTYGRKGRRRRELMAPLMSLADGPTDGVQFQATGHKDNVDLERNGPKATLATDSTNSEHIPELSPQLRALAQSQIQHPPELRSRPPLRRLAVSIPKLNTWHRPMPPSRVKNMLKDHYADLLNKILPPLPTQDWERLRDLAMGKRSEELIPRRKSTSQAKSLTALEAVVVHGKTSQRQAFGNRQARELNPRNMRRLWAEVFTQCPRMDWDKEKQTWNVTWGGHVLHDSSLPFSLSDDTSAARTDGKLSVNVDQALIDSNKTGGPAVNAHG